MDHDEELPISVRMVMCPAERERDPSSCRASGIPPELPVLVLVPPVLFPPLIRLQALVTGVQRQPHPLLFPGLPSDVSSSPAGDRIVESTLLPTLFCGNGSIQART